MTTTGLCSWLEVTFKCLSAKPDCGLPLRFERALTSCWPIGKLLTSSASIGENNQGGIPPHQQRTEKKLSIVTHDVDKSFQLTPPSRQEEKPEQSVIVVIARLGLNARRAPNAHPGPCVSDGDKCPAPLLTLQGSARWLWLQHIAIHAEEV